MARPNPRGIDCGQLYAGVIFLILAVLALCCRVGWLAIFVVLLVNGFIVCLILCAARTAEAGNPRGFNEKFPWLPSRIAALVLVPLLLFAEIVAFADIYIWSGGVVSDAAKLGNAVDAVYFSVVTITTLGYGDFHPINLPAKVAVMGELLCGIIMLIGAFPLLVGRLNFPNSPTV